MITKKIIGQQALLDAVEKPSRYLGTEINAIAKDPSLVDVRLVLAFPDLYEIGTSYFGMQILYHLLNQQPHISAERVFAPARDMENQMRASGHELASLESGTPLKRFDIIGFSLLYELNYTNVLNMLDLARLPLLSKDRSVDHPFIIAGGPCVCNPEPMADFFDAMVFGDGEEIFLEMVTLWQDWKKQRRGRRSLLEQWAQIEGVYIPQFFDVSYDLNGFQQLTPLVSNYTAVRRRIAADLDETFFPDHPIVPFGRPVHDRLRLEISRGCTRGCRFCQAGMIYRPVRERSPETLLSLCRSSLAATGYEDLSLLSLSTGDYTCLTGLMDNLMTVCKSDRVAVSLPSVRAGTLSPRLMETIRQVRKTGFTIAPEAGSQRLRNVINKNITYDDIAQTIQDAFSLGWRLIKLYFMIGLPTETQADVDAIAELIHRLKRIRGAGNHGGRLNVSINSFIPKPHTPFQWAVQLNQEQSRRTLEQLKFQLKKVSVSLKWQNPDMAIIEGVFSRGDRRLSAVLQQARRMGCSFDGWADRFDYSLWEKAFESVGISMEHYIQRVRSLDEPLPWRHMDARVSEVFLKQQWQAAHQAETVTDCRYDQCHQCGTCDFSQIFPKLFYKCEQVESPTNTSAEIEKLQERTIEFTYCKIEQARYFGHLEVANIFARALRRSGIKLRYSVGFHPMPRISFDDPLPLGMESQAENVRISLMTEMDNRELMDRINGQLPSGLKIQSCRLLTKEHAADLSIEDSYIVYYPEQMLDPLMVQDFLSAPQWYFEKKRSNGKIRQIDLKSVVKYIGFPASSTMELVLVRHKNYTLRPADVLTAVFNIPRHQICLFRTVKTAPCTKDSQTSQKSV